jgi:hypothetical protein
MGFLPRKVQKRALAMAGLLRPLKSYRHGVKGSKRPLKKLSLIRVGLHCLALRNSVSFSSYLAQNPLLIRAVSDSCSDALVWEDDSLVCKVSAYKIYDDQREPGAMITVKSLGLV